MKKGIVAGIGQAAKDIIIVVDRYPEYGLKKRVEDIFIDGGGPVGNALHTVSRLGLKARILTVIGDDDEGDFIRRRLNDSLIDTRFIIRRRNAHSHIAYIIVERQSGDRTIFYRLCTASDIKPAEIDRRFFEGISFLHLDGFQKEISVFAARYARENNIPVMLDAGSYKDYVDEIIRHTDYLVASSIFAGRYGFDGTLKRFKELVNYFKRPHITVTMGERGSFTYHQGEIFRTPAFGVDVNDTTGAGDVFHGAMIYGILKGFDIVKTIRFASVVAALKCREYGGRKGVPSLSTALYYLRRFKERTIYY